MDLNNSFISTINLNIIPYLTIINSFELILLLSSVLITAIIVFLYTSNGLFHIHLIYLGKICGACLMISASFRIAIIVGKFLGITKMGKVEITKIRNTRLSARIRAFTYYISKQTTNIAY